MMIGSLNEEARPLPCSSEADEEPPAKRRRLVVNDSQNAKENGAEISEMDEMESDTQSGSKDKEEGRAGILKSISLKNFMCHSSLDIKLSPRSNFITGVNGSGKSAILAALVVGLGGKSGATGRGSSLKGFIKDGQQTAEVSIQLTNHGKDGFKIDTYGKSITVERRFSRDGSSQYKIKNEKGRKITSSREDLERILEHFCIQVENPVTILNQTTSKTFLFTNSSNDKYKFFMRATLLHTLGTQYAEANESRKVAQEILTEKQATMPEMSKEVKKWKQKYDGLKSVETLSEKVETLKNEMAWAFVCQREKTAAQMKRQLRILECRTPKYTQKVEQSQKSIDAMKEKHTVLKEDIFKMKDAGQDQKCELVHAKLQAEEKKKAHRIAQTEQKKIVREWDKLEKDIKDLNERIAEIKKSSSRSNEEEKQKLLEILRQIETEILSTENEKQQVMDAMNKLKDEQHRLRGDDQDLSRNLSTKSKKKKVPTATLR